MPKKRKTPKKKVKYYKLEVNGKIPRKLGYWGTAINNKFPKWTGAFKHQRHRLIAGIPCKIKKFY